VLGKLSVPLGPEKELMTRYNWRPQIPSGNGPTGAHILVALTAAFGTLAFFSLLHSASNLKSGAVSFFLVVSELPSYFDALLTHPAIHQPPRIHLIPYRSHHLGNSQEEVQQRPARFRCPLRSCIRIGHYRMVTLPRFHSPGFPRLVQEQGL
jgi:hypothetical protein